MINYRIIFDDYPYCFGYLDVYCRLTPKLEKWCKENNISYKLTLDGDDIYSSVSMDTISFKNREDAALFKLTWS